MVQRPPVAARRGVRRVCGFLQREERQARIWKLPLKPGETTVEAWALPTYSIIDRISEAITRTHFCSALKAALWRPTGGRGTANCWFWLADGGLWRWELLRAGRWLGGQLPLRCAADGCNCLCKGGGPHSTAAVEAGVRVGLLSQALGRRDETTGRSWAFVDIRLIRRDVYIHSVPVTIKARVSLRCSAGREVFGRAGLSFHFAERWSMKHHCRHTNT